MSTHLKRQKNIKSTLSLVKRGVKELAIEVGESFFEALETYLLQIERFSMAYNITGFKDPERLAERGIIDSLLYLEFIPEGNIKVLDIGSGAGMPGLIMKMARPALSMTLVEPSRKKATFLEFVINRLGFSDIEVLQEEIESYAKTPNPYDVITTRALFRTEQFIKKASPFMKGDTRLVISKGPKVFEEIRALQDRPFRWQIVTKTLPLSGIKRYFLVIQKI